MSKKTANVIYWLTLVGPIASVIKTCLETVIDILKGKK